MDVSVLAYISKGSVAFLGRVPKVILKSELSGEETLDWDYMDTTITGLYKIEGTLFISEEGYPIITDYVYKKQPMPKGKLIAVDRGVVIPNWDMDDMEEDSIVAANEDKPNGLYKYELVKLI